MISRNSSAAIFGITALCWIVSIAVYPQFPDRIALHWGVDGLADGYGSKGFGLFIVPVLMLMSAGMFIYLPRFDRVHQANFMAFREQYETFSIIYLIFMLMVQAFLILWNKGVEIPVGAVMSLGLGVLFYYSGVLCEHAKQNLFAGFRTPWTLRSERVWDRTHKLAGKLFKAAGLIALVGVVLPPAWALAVIIVPPLAASVYIFVFSYLEARKENSELRP